MVREKCTHSEMKERSEVSSLVSELFSEKGYGPFDIESLSR